MEKVDLSMGLLRMVFEIVKIERTSLPSIASVLTGRSVWVLYQRSIFLYLAFLMLCGMSWRWIVFSALGSLMRVI